MDKQDNWLYRWFWWHDLPWKRILHFLIIRQFVHVLCMQVIFWKVIGNVTFEYEWHDALTYVTYSIISSTVITKNKEKFKETPLHTFRMVADFKVVIAWKRLLPRCQLHCPNPVDWRFENLQRSSKQCIASVMLYILHACYALRYGWINLCLLLNYLGKDTHIR